MMKSCGRSIAGLVAAAAVAGCGREENVERTAPTETQRPQVEARAKLRDIGAPPAGHPPNEPFGYNGAENTTVELVRTVTGRFKLIVDSGTWELHTVVVADGTCAGYAQTFSAADAGTEIFREQWRPDEPYDEDDLGATGERRELPLPSNLAERMLAGPVTVFADSGGAHGGEYQHCGPLQPVSP